MKNKKIICSIYKTNKQDEMYLFVKKGQDMAKLPKPLLSRFGQPVHAMDLLLTEQRQLARADVKVVMYAIEEQGFYLQLPPVEDNHER